MQRRVWPGRLGHTRLRARGWQSVGKDAAQRRGWRRHSADAAVAPHVRRQPGVRPRWNVALRGLLFRAVDLRFLGRDEWVKLRDFYGVLTLFLFAKAENVGLV